MARRGTKLDDEQKAFVVERLACWETPEEVARAVKAEFGVEVSRQSIEAYDPTKRAGASLGKRWRTLFEKARERFKTDLDSIPEAHKAVRIQRLAALARSARSPVLAADLLEQIAKEVGGAFTNRREITGKDGKPIAYRDVGDLTDEQLDTELQRELGGAPGGAAAGG